MTTENWIMIAPILLLIVVATTFIPSTQRAQKKYAGLVAKKHLQEAKQAKAEKAKLNALTEKVEQNTNAIHEIRRENALLELQNLVTKDLGEILFPGARMSENGAGKETDRPHQGKVFRHK